MRMFISINGLSKSYGVGAGYVKVLDEIELEIERGTIAVILGASGSGKSTLLNCIGGLDIPDEGRIKVADELVTGRSQRELTEFRRRHLGFIFQFYNLIPNLTVRENIQVCEHLTRDPLDMREILDLLGLAEHANKFPSQLSGGQQQRCAIARALVKRPELLLCDEPTGALDSQTSIDVLELLSRVNTETGATMCIVTHNAGIAAMGDDVIRLQDGKITDRQHNDSRTPVKDISW